MDGVELKAPETGDMVAVTAVSASGSTITPAYTTSGAAAGATEFTVSFTSAWVKANGGATITLTYTGVLTGDKVNEAAHVNTAQLTYTSEPGATKTASSSVNAYTFEISDGFLKKVTKDKNGTQETIKALAGAEFTLYTDSDCTTQYYNTNYTSAQAYTVISDQDGKLVISGLDAGTYYLKETKAPTGYSLNDTVYTIKVEAVTDTGTTELTSWTISVGDQSTTNTITADGTVTKGAITTTEIMNTKLSALPATGGFGTAIFTAVGCLIMIAAAALFFTSRRKTTK
jgi:LPXTG-motif cell wall-anchored protein